MQLATLNAACYTKCQWQNEHLKDDEFKHPHTVLQQQLRQKKTIERDEQLDSGFFKETLSTSMNSPVNTKNNGSPIVFKEGKKYSDTLPRWMFDETKAHVGEGFCSS